MENILYCEKKGKKCPQSNDCKRIIPLFIFSFNIFPFQIALNWRYRHIVFLINNEYPPPWITIITMLILSFCLQSKESNNNKKFIQEWKIGKIDFYLKIDREGEMQSPWQYTVIKEIFEPVEKSNTSNPGSWTPLYNAFTITQSIPWLSPQCKLSTSSLLSMASYFRKEKKNPAIFLSPQLLMKIYLFWSNWQRNSTPENNMCR